MKRRILLGLLGCLLGVWSRSPAQTAGFDVAETAATLRIWHGQDGLPSDTVTAVPQTRDGFLWVGTSAGLVRFDGAAFTKVAFMPAATNRAAQKLPNEAKARKS